MHKSPVPSNAALGLQLLQVPATGGFESAGPQSAGPALGPHRINASMEAVQEAFSSALQRAGAARNLVAGRQQQVLENGRSALVKLAAEGERAEVTQDELHALEAVVIADGSRPALFVQDDRVDPSVPQAGPWSGLITSFHAGISAVARSVGRIALRPDGAVKGTGFCVAPGLVLTNRHVLQVIADQNAQGAWVLRSNDVAIDFGGEHERPKRKNVHRITGVAYAAPVMIDFQEFDFTKLDMALLKVDLSGNPNPFPAALPLLKRVEALLPDSKIFALGFPAEPAPGYEPGDVLRTVFQDEYDVKRFAPGNVMLQPDDLDDGGHHRVFTHNASTLGGNSGSCVVELSAEGKGVVGLHFGGFRRDRNFAHAIARLEGVLNEHGVELA